jgi:hypothetical protein
MAHTASIKKFTPDSIAGKDSSAGRPEEISRKSQGGSSEESQDARICSEAGKVCLRYLRPSSIRLTARCRTKTVSSTGSTGKPSVMASSRISNLQEEDKQSSRDEKEGSGSEGSVDEGVYS